MYMIFEDGGRNRVAKISVDIGDAPDLGKPLGPFLHRAHLEQFGIPCQISYTVLYTPLETWFLLPFLPIYYCTGGSSLSDRGLISEPMSEQETQYTFVEKFQPEDFGCKAFIMRFVEGTKPHLVLCDGVHAFPFPFYNFYINGTICTGHVKPEGDAIRYLINFLSSRATPHATHDPKIEWKREDGKLCPTPLQFKLNPIDFDFPEELLRKPIAAISPI